MTYEEQCNLRVGDVIAFEESHTGTIISISPDGARSGVRVSWRHLLSSVNFTLFHNDLLSPKYIFKRHAENTVGIEEFI